MINITLPDGSVRSFEHAVSALEVAKDIHPGLARKVVSAEVDGEVWDATRAITKDASLKLLTMDDEWGQKTFWHSSAHLMAEALEEIYPGVKFGIGPPIDSGFYYDVDLGDRQLSADELPAIEKKMKELAKRNSQFERTEVSKADAIAFFKEKNDEYKLDLLEDLEDGTITFYKQGNFTDLCRGPHIADTSTIKAVKLLNIAGAYWRGDESKKQLTRIYGVTFPKQKLLDEHLEMLEEAKKRDHRKIGKELELFAFSEKVGGGLPLWLPNGTIVRDLLTEFLKKEQVKRGYKLVMTPHIGRKELYQTSGHWEKYGEDSYRPITTPHEGEEYLLKPMNCPHHCEIYKNKPFSYRELPVRLAEFGTVYRYEQSGEINGLTRVRGFTQDDAHIFCRPDQLKEEFKDVIDLVFLVLNKLDFGDFTAQISLRDPENKEKYIGSDESWDAAEQAIIEATSEMDLETVQVKGEAAFYGPKLDFMVKDALKRPWQLGTIQVDYNLPERFNLEYVGADNQKHRPVMIHRAPFGSMERFLGVLIEHCAGKFPLWLTPTQVSILPISDKFTDFAVKVHDELKKHDIRVSLDLRNEKIGRKIREAELQRIPYMLVIGQKEVDESRLSVRRQGQGDQGTSSIPDFIAKILRESEV